MCFRNRVVYEKKNWKRGDIIARNVPKYSVVKDYQVVLINSDVCSNSEELFDSKVMIAHDSLQKIISDLSNDGESSTHCVSISMTT